MNRDIDSSFLNDILDSFPILDFRFDKPDDFDPVIDKMLKAKLFSVFSG